MVSLRTEGVHAAALGPGACWLGDPVAVAQAREAHAAGLVADRPGDCVLVAGGVANRHALRRLVEGAGGRDALAVLPPASASFLDSPGLGAPVTLAFLAGGGEASPERLARAARVVLPVRERVVDVPVGDRAGGRTRSLPLGDVVVCPTGTWLGLLWANLLGLPAALVEAFATPRWAVLPRTLAWSLRAGSLDPLAIGAQANRIERGASVHPSAVVESSWVRAGARIGPGAVVRGTVLGECAVVEPLALAVGSVLGSGARLQRAGWIQYGVLAEGAAHGGAAQLSVLGAGARVKGGAFLLDQRVDEEVRLRIGGELHPVPLGFAGVGVGAGAFVGCGVRVAAGRTIPPDERRTASGS